jgi:CheY-like chemotaxis protein
VPVLVLDDSVDAADTLAVLLDLMGCVVRVAYAGPDALARVAEAAPEVVILDIGLPGMDGWEVTRRVRASLGRRVLIVAHTGYGRPEDHARSDGAGVDLHLLKPADLDAVERVVALARTRRGSAAPD